MIVHRRTGQHRNERVTMSVMVDMNQMGAGEPLSYASRTETDLLIRAYQLVGWYVVLVAGAAVVNLAIFALIGYQQGAGLTFALSIAASSAPTMLAAIGGIGMVLGRKWGAPVVVGCAALTLLTYAASAVLSGGMTSANGAFAMANAIGRMASALVNAFLPIAMWLLCRRHGAFRW